MATQIEMSEISLLVVQTKVSLGIFQTGENNKVSRQSPNNT